MSEENTIGEVRNGNASAYDALVTKYKSLVRSKARAYFITGCDKDDIVQEGMIGLFKAIRDFNPDKGIPFRVFAEICVDRQIISAVKAGARQKHIPLNSSLPLGRPLPAAGVTTPDPEQILIGREEKRYIKEHLLSALSTMELRVLSLHLSGMSYAEISEQTQRGVKSIDNALRRVRRKTEKFLKMS